MVHESVIKRRPELVHFKRKTKKGSKFCDPKVARRYFNQVEIILELYAPLILFSYWLSFEMWKYLKKLI